jgi:hypothetical protein
VPACKPHRRLLPRLAALTARPPPPRRSFNAGLVLPAEAGELQQLEALALDWTCPEVLEQVLRRLEAQGRGRGRGRGPQQQQALPPAQQAPPQLWPALRELSLRSNALERFPLPPAACAALRSLASLDLGVNSIAALPAAAACLTSLRFLGLRLNELQAGGLPEELGALRELRVLDVSGCAGLVALPSWCSRLERVDVRWTGCEGWRAGA